MGATYNFHPRFAEGSGSKAETPDQLLNRQPGQKIWTAMSLVSLSLGFSIFGILIILNRHRADLNGLSGDSFAATVGGITAILVGTAFLVAGCLHSGVRQTFCSAVGWVPICPFNFLETQVSHANRWKCIPVCAYNPKA
jgi:hypothetical protein